jgi:hypothetical protein
MLRFSGLMANYNNGRYIDEAIRSVLAQTFNDWELIIPKRCRVSDQGRAYVSNKQV